MANLRREPLYYKLLSKDFDMFLRRGRGGRKYASRVIESNLNNFEAKKRPG
jgi:hypothetical protein